MPPSHSGRRSSLPVHQPTLLLGHGPVHWTTLPSEVRERVLVLWLQLLTDHGAHQTAAQTADAAASRQIGGPAR